MNTLDQAKQRIRHAYSPEAFQLSAKSFAQIVSGYFESVANEPYPALCWHRPEILSEEFLSTTTGNGEVSTPQVIADRYTTLGQMFLKYVNRLHSPHYMGHQVPAALPLASLFDGLASATNQPMAVYEMGPSATAAEKAMIRVLGNYLGWEPGFAAIGTHGGSLANLTALLTARNCKYPDFWAQGYSDATGKPAILCSEEAHYCNTRAAGILGIGTHQVLQAPIDSSRRLDASNLEKRLDDAAKDGFDVFAIVASSCSTPTGAFDPLEEIAEITRARGIWLHVDGAHGAGALISRKHRHLLAGVEHADSVTWDAHKMLFVPALCTLLFYRNREDSFRTFEQDAPYLFDPNAPGMAEFDGAVRTVECTKRAMCAGLWGVWSIFGAQLFEDLVDVTFDLAEQFHKILKSEVDFETLHQPACNIVCFRYVPEDFQNASPQQIGALQQQLRRFLIESGEFYITSTRIDGVMALRVTLINPLTDTDHLYSLLDAIREHGRRCRR